VTGMTAILPESSPAPSGPPETPSWRSSSVTAAEALGKVISKQPSYSHRVTRPAAQPVGQIHGGLSFSTLIPPQSSPGCLIGNKVIDLCRRMGPGTALDCDPNSSHSARTPGPGSRGWEESPPAQPA
jgi:hypothetical protein